MPKRKASRKSVDIKQHLRITEEKLHRLEENKSLFTKNMLKFGFAAWVFGLSAFFFAIVMVNVELFGKAPPNWISLLVGAPAAPVMITAALVRKFDIKIKRLKHIRGGLMKKYQKAVLRNMWGR